MPHVYVAQLTYELLAPHGPSLHIKCLRAILISMVVSNGGLKLTVYIFSSTVLPRRDAAFGVVTGSLVYGLNNDGHKKGTLRFA